jgi:hypothetical protein
MTDFDETLKKNLILRAFCFYVYLIRFNFSLCDVRTKIIDTVKVDTRSFV